MADRDPRVYTEQEATRILRNAARLQETARGAESSPSGLSEEELKRIAQESGIAAEFLDQAIQSPVGEVRSTLFNLVEEHERVFDTELTPEELDEAIEEIARRVSVKTSLMIGRTRRFQVHKGSLFGTLELTIAGGRTRLRLKQVPFIPYFAGLHAPLILAIVGFANFAVRGLWIPALLSVLFLLTLGCTLFAVFAQAGKRRATAAVDEMADVISSIARRRRVPGVQSSGTETVQERIVELS